MLMQEPCQPKKRGRKAKPICLDTLSVAIDPQMGEEISLWAKRAGVSRSELGRYIWTDALARIKRRGRNWLKNELAERRNAGRDTSREDAEEAYFASLRVAEQARLKRAI